MEFKYNIDSATPHRDRVIKVCGNCNPHNIGCVSVLTPMMMGFIFTERSKRSALGLDPTIIKNLPDYIEPVAVFLDADFDFITTITSTYGIKLVQLHGKESTLLCQRLKDAGYTLLKAIAVGENLPVKQIMEYAPSVDLFVFDTLCEGGGGSGQKFDWSLLEDYPDCGVPYLLGGGVGPDDIAQIVQAMRPAMAGIDINSRFESSPGLKDIATLSNFILTLRTFNEQ